MPAQEAWAYWDNEGIINTRTVGATELEAYVNAICILSNREIMPLDWWNLEACRSVFIALYQGNGQIGKVWVSTGA